MQVSGNSYRKMIMYCNSKKKCTHLQIQKDKSGYCDILHVQLKLSEHKPKDLFIQDTDCMEVLPAEASSIKTCNPGMTKCVYLTMEYPVAKSEIPSGFCQKYNETLTYDSDILMFHQFNLCNGIKLESKAPPKRVIVEDILVKKPVIQPGDVNPVCDLCKCYITSENPQPWPDGKYYHDDCVLNKYGEKVNKFKPLVPPLNSASRFLTKADDTLKERGKTYDKQDDGESERSMGKTVEAFNAITGRDLKESEGWLLMLVLKQTRQYSTDEYHEDSALDSVAYSALLAEALSNE